MNSQSQRILDKLDGLDTRLDKVDVRLAEYNTILDEHQRRSLALEALVELERKAVASLDNKLTAHIGKVTGIGIAFSGLIAVLGILAKFF